MRKSTNLLKQEKSWYRNMCVLHTWSFANMNWNPHLNIYTISQSEDYWTSQAPEFEVEMVIAYTHDLEKSVADSLQEAQEAMLDSDKQMNFDDLKEEKVRIKVHPAWSPLGAARFKELVEEGYYNDTRIFRAVPNFMTQFGLRGVFVVGCFMYK